VTILERLPFQAVLPDNHLLALRKRIALAELEGDPFIGFAEEAFPGRNHAISAGCQAAGFIPHFKTHVENLTALLAQVASGKGVTLAPAEVSQLAHPQAVFIPLAPPVPSIVSAAAQRKEAGNLLLQELLACCQKNRTLRPRKRLTGTKRR
jgi:DNA-binding transcriptional LysR family regulator